MTTIELPKPRSLASRPIPTTHALRPATRQPAASSQRPATAHMAVDNPAVMAMPAKVALVAAVASIPPITVLHLSASGAVEPGTWTISDYVVTLPYGTALFGMTTGALAVGAVALIRGLIAITGTRTVRVLLAVWAAAMLGLSIFPTNLRGTPQDVSSNVHLIAGAVVFAVLPVIGLLIVRRQRAFTGRNLTTIVTKALSTVSGVLSSALILNRLPGVIGMPELMLPPGLLQRAAGAVEILLLAVIAAGLLQAARESR